MLILEQPLLTIGISTYNSAHFLRDYVGSVERQNLDNYEIVIVDNASEDNTEDVYVPLEIVASAFSEIDRTSDPVLITMSVC